MYIDIIIDLTDAEFEAYRRQGLKDAIPDSGIREYLPFLTSVSEGSNYFHIRNDSVYPVATKRHTVEQGDTLCMRGGDNTETVRLVAPTCPGCIAKAKNIVVAHLLSTAGNPSEGVENKDEYVILFKLATGERVRSTAFPGFYSLKKAKEICAGMTIRYSYVDSREHPGK